MQVRQMGIKHNSLYLHRQETEVRQRMPVLPPINGGASSPLHLCQETEGAPALPMFSLAKDNDSSNEGMGLSTIPEGYYLKV